MGSCAASSEACRSAHVLGIVCPSAHASKGARIVFPLGHEYSTAMASIASHGLATNPRIRDCGELVSMPAHASELAAQLPMAIRPIS